jgi:uncharacterized protein
MLKIFIFLVFSFINCATSYAQKIQPVENAIYSGDYETAIPKLRELVTGSNDKDKLLYLMEAGVALHTKGDYEASNKAFTQAEEIADTARKSASGEALAFALSDNESNFIGEDFERVMIKFYMALNYLCLGDLESAKRYFKRVEFEQKEMRATEAKYKQNVLARFLDAIVSEALENYNDARVEYRNILDIEPNNIEMLGQRLVLAMKEKDNSDIAKFSGGRDFIKAYNNKTQGTVYNPNMGELIIINQAGKSAVKESRGRLMDDPNIAAPLRSAIEVAIRSESQAGMSVGGVIALMGSAEHPIPIYRDRTSPAQSEVEIFVNGVSVGQTQKLSDYSGMAKNSFNENYESLVRKNIASIATKAVIASSIAFMAGELSKQGKDKEDMGTQMLGSAVSFVTGLLAGYAVSNSIAPDLRCWRTIPANFQARRIFLEPGEYEISFRSTTNSPTPPPQKVTIESRKPIFLSFRSL